MKKVGLVACGLFFVLILSGCAKEEKNNTEKTNQETNEVSVENNQENQAGDSNESGIMKKLKNALSSGKKMKCTYVIGDEVGKTEIVTYIQGDKYKTEVNIGQMKTVSVFDGDVMYSWSEGQKSGTKMSMDCLNSLDAGNESEKENTQEDSSVQNEEEFMDTLANAENLNCEDAGDVDFEIPSDVTFTDQCEVLKSQQKMLEGFGKQQE